MFRPTVRFLQSSAGMSAWASHREMKRKRKCAWEFLDPMKFIIQFNINQNSKTRGDSARTIDFFWPTCSFGALSPSGMSVANGAAEPKNVNHQPQKQKKQNKTIQDKKRQQRVEVTNGM